MRVIDLVQVVLKSQASVLGEAKDSDANGGQLALIWPCPAEFCLWTAQMGSWR